MSDNIKYSLLVWLQVIGVSCFSQIQMGNDLVSDSDSDEFGFSISISANGKVLAIGDIEYSDQIPYSGQVQVYKWMNQGWEQLGTRIVGDAYDGFGYSVALSDSGMRLIVRALGSHDAKVFEYIGSQWVQVGYNIPVGHGNVTYISDVAMSSNGNIIAISDTDFPQLGIQNGLVKVYHYQSPDWKQMGNDIIGENEKDQSGFSISMSADGTAIAIGSINDNSGGDHAGQVRIFKFIDGDWKQIEDGINGKAQGCYVGKTLSLSSDGNRVAFGGFNCHNGTNTKGYVGIYEFKGVKWELVGNEINGLDNEQFGGEVSLEGKGDRVAIASTGNADCPLRIFDLINGEWKQVGRAIKTNREFPSTGHAIGLSRDGNIIATATRLNGGIVQVYDISNITPEDAIGVECNSYDSTEMEIADIKISPNPTDGVLIVTGADLNKLWAENKILIFDAVGRLLGGYQIFNNTIDLTSFPAGMYIISFDNRIEKIIKVSL